MEFFKHVKDHLYNIDNHDAAMKLWFTFYLAAPPYTFVTGCGSGDQEIPVGRFDADMQCFSYCMSLRKDFGINGTRYQPSNGECWCIAGMDSFYSNQLDFTSCYLPSKLYPGKFLMRLALPYLGEKPPCS